MGKKRTAKSKERKFVAVPINGTNVYINELVRNRKNDASLGYPDDYEAVEWNHPVHKWVLVEYTSIRLMQYQQTIDYKGSYSWTRSWLVTLVNVDDIGTKHIRASFQQLSVCPGSHKHLLNEMEVKEGLYFILPMIPHPRVLGGINRATNVNKE